MMIFSKARLSVVILNLILPLSSFASSEPIFAWDFLCKGKDGVTVSGSKDVGDVRSTIQDESYFWMTIDGQEMGKEDLLVSPEEREGSRSVLSFLGNIHGLCMPGECEGNFLDIYASLALVRENSSDPEGRAVGVLTYSVDRLVGNWKEAKKEHKEGRVDLNCYIRSAKDVESYRKMIEKAFPDFDPPN